MLVDVCVCVSANLLLLNDFLCRHFIYSGGNVLLCCRDAGNIKGRLEHLVSSIQNTLAHFDICIPNETSAIGAEYLQLTSRERGRVAEKTGIEGGWSLPEGLVPLLY